MNDIKEIMKNISNFKELHTYLLTKVKYLAEADYIDYMEFVNTKKLLQILSVYYTNRVSINPDLPVPEDIMLMETLLQKLETKFYDVNPSNEMSR